MALALTDEKIATLVAELGAGDRIELGDSTEPGLLLRAGPRGGRWSLRLREGQGLRPRVLLGSWPQLDVEAARAAAKTHRDTAPADGRAPAAEALRVLLERYRRLRLSQLRSGGPTYRSLRHGLRDLLDRDVASITRRDISEAIFAVAETAPSHANRILAYTKALFGWAVGHGYLDANPAASVSRPVREKPRERTPTLQELAAIWRGADLLSYPWGPIVKLLILLAARRQEVGSMRVNELSLPPGGGGFWTIPAERSKNGRAIRIPLSPLARQAVDDALVLRIDDEKSPWLFSTTGKTPVSGWSKAKASLDRAIAWGDVKVAVWRFHDFRRAFATNCCDHLDAPPALVDRCLNHVGASTTSTVGRVYERSELYEQRKALLERWEALLLTHIGPLDRPDADD